MIEFTVSPLSKSMPEMLVNALLTRMLRIKLAGYHRSFDVLSKHCDMADIIIGNREEFDVIEHTTMPGNKDNDHSAKALLEKDAGTIIKAAERL